MNILFCQLFLLIFAECLFLRRCKGHVLLSQNRSANLSSQYNHDSPASKAVDGDLRQTWPNVAATGNSSSVYWYVDLGASRNIYIVVIYYRKEQTLSDHSFRKRFAGFSLYISDDTNFKSGYNCGVNSTYPPLIYIISCQYVGRYVRLYNNRGDNQAILELAEVQVFGCISSTIYGVNCENSCSSQCKSQRCNIVDGKCLSCPAGYKGDFCDIVCEHDTYGFDCNFTCSGKCNDNDPCNFVTGFCDTGCADGWTGSKCDTKCNPGRFGVGCLNNCSMKCKNGALCHHVTGACNYGCIDGFYLDNCSLSCSGNCLANAACNSSSGTCEEGCSAGWKSESCDVECSKYEYGISCSQKCGKCRNGVRCDKITGQCISGCSPGYLTHLCNESCPSGYFGEDCLLKCSGNCLNKIACNVGNGYCDGGCDNGWKGDRCDEEMLLENQSHTSQLIIGVSSLSGILAPLIILGIIVYLLLRRLTNNHLTSENSNTNDSTKTESKTTGKEGNTAEEETENASKYLNTTIYFNERAEEDSTDETEYQELPEILDDNVYDDAISN